MSARGEYRSISTVLARGKDFRRLSPAAKLVFYTVKMELGPSGIDVYDVELLPKYTGLPDSQIDEALADLREQDWIRWEDNVVWIVRGLEFEPSLSRTNPNHRKSVASHLRGLPHLAIVEAFASHYAGWLAGSDSLADGIPMPSGSLADQGKGKGDGEGDGETPLGASGDAPAEDRDEEGQDGDKPPQSVLPYSAEFDEVWNLYPRRPNDSKRRAFKAWRARCRSGVEPTMLRAGAERYAAYIDATGKAGTEFVKQGATFFGPDEHYLAPWDVEAPVGRVPNTEAGRLAEVLLKAEAVAVDPKTAYERLSLAVTMQAVSLDDAKKAWGLLKPTGAIISPKVPDAVRQVEGLLRAAAQRQPVGAS